MAGEARADAQAGAGGGATAAAGEPTRQINIGPPSTAQMEVLLRQKALFHKQLGMGVVDNIGVHSFLCPLNLS